MTSRSLKATTAILAALSLLQPLPALTQSSSAVDAGENGATAGQGNRIDQIDIRTFEEICAEAMMADARACELHIRELLVAAEAESEAATDAAAKAATEAGAAEALATEAEATEQAAAEAEAERLALVAAEAEARVTQAADAVARLAVQAEAAAQAVAETRAQVAAEAATQTAEQAADEAAAEDAAEAAAEADAAAQAEAETDAQAESEAEAAEQDAEEADAAAQATTDAEAAALAADEADAQAEAEARTESKAEAEAEAEQDDDSPTETATETPVERAPVAEDCLAEVVDPDGTIRCVDALTPDGIAAIAAETGVEGEAQPEVTTESITEDTRRSSSEEFSDRSPDDTADLEDSLDTLPDEPAAGQRGSGLSDLEKAGLLALGAVVVGAILSNGQRVEANTGDRVIVVDDEGSYRVLKDDDALLRQPGSDVRTERFDDGSTRTTVTRDDGTRIITIRDSTGRALQRRRIDPDGRDYLLIDDTRAFEPVVVQDLPSPVYEDFDYRAASDRESLREALLAADRRDLGRSFSLRQVRDYVEVRELAPEINFEAITFRTNSAALEPSQAERLRQMGMLLRDLIADDPTELFLVEGHTDAVGTTGHNLLLSDRRAESVALAFTEYFGVPAENMIVQGYGESFLKIRTEGAERLNRRVAVRRITPLVQPY